MYCRSLNIVIINQRYVRLKKIIKKRPPTLSSRKKLPIFIAFDHR